MTTSAKPVRLYAAVALLAADIHLDGSRELQPTQNHRVR
jgi:hypothetical protein